MKNRHIEKLNEQSLEAIWDNKPARARRLAMASLKLGKSIDGYTNLAFASSDLQQAEMCLRNAIKQSNRPFLPRANLVLVLAAQGRFRDALKEHQKNKGPSLRRSPSDFYFKKAKLMASVDQRRKGTRLIKIAMRSVSNKERKKMASQWDHYSHCWSWAGKVWQKGKALRTHRNLLS